MKPFAVAINILQVAAPGLPVTTIVCAPDAVPKLVKKLFISVAESRLPEIVIPLVNPVAVNFCSEFILTNICVVLVTLAMFKLTAKSEVAALNIAAILVTLAVLNKGTDCSELQP
jgi:hypothetical protein